MEVKDAEIAFSPGFRWGTTLLPGQDITREMMMDQMAITYPSSTLTEMSGTMIKIVLEDVAENLFHPDPYYQQGGDMVRVGGLTYTCTPAAGSGGRISDMRLRGKPIEADKTYRVGGWAPVAEGVTGEPIWDVVETYLRDRRTISPAEPNRPKVVGVEGNPGLPS
jgi:sulfur-oxidizing protein SoxB